MLKVPLIIFSQFVVDSPVDFLSASSLAPFDTPERMDFLRRHAGVLSDPDKVCVQPALMAQTVHLVFLQPKRPSCHLLLAQEQV